MAEGAQLSRRRFIGTLASAGAGGLAMAGILTACGKSASGGQETTEAGATTSAGQTTANNAKPFLIGSPYPISGLGGSSAADGEEMKGGSDLAIAEINDSGGIAGRTIEHSIVDTDINTPDGVTTAMNKVIADEPDALAIGYLIAYAPSLDIGANYGAPYLNASTSQGQVDTIASDPKYANIFQIDPPESYYGYSFAPFLEGLIADGVFTPPEKTIHILEGDIAYSQWISKTAQQKAEELGWKIVGVDPVKTGQSDWTSVISKVHQTNPAVVMDTHWKPDDLAAFAKQWAANPTSSLVYLQYGPSIPTFLQIAGAAAEGIIWSTDTGVYNDVIGLAYQDRYKTKWGKPAGFSNSGSGYDEVYMLARAWAKTGDPRNFKANITEIKSMIHRGVNGGYWFGRPENKGNAGENFPTQNQDPSLAQACLYFQIQKDATTGELANKIVSPPPYVEVTYVKQPWLTF